MSELSKKVMEKVGKIYLMRRVGAFVLKCVFATAVTYIIGTFVFVRAIVDNVMAAIGRGDVALYIVDAFSKAEMSVLVLLAIAIILFVAALNDIRKITFGVRLSPQ